MPTATVTSKGQITIPREVRDHLHVGTGDKIDFVIEANGAVRISPLVGSVRELYGFLRRRGRAPSVRAMDEALVDHLSRENARTRTPKRRRR